MDLLVEQNALKARQRARPGPRTGERRERADPSRLAEFRRFVASYVLFDKGWTCARVAIELRVDVCRVTVWKDLFISAALL